MLILFTIHAPFPEKGDKDALHGGFVEGDADVYLDEQESLAWVAEWQTH